MASCSTSRSRRIADVREPPASPAPASPRAATIAAGALVTLAGTCSPPRSNIAACPMDDVPGASRDDQRARDAFDPRHRDHGRVRVERIHDIERGAEPLVGRVLVRRPFRRESDLDDADVGGGLDPAGRDDLVCGVDHFRAGGTCTLAPTAAIFPSAMRIVPFSIAGPATGRIRAFVIATTGPDPNPLGVAAGPQDIGLFRRWTPVPRTLRAAGVRRGSAIGVRPPCRGVRPRWEAGGEVAVGLDRWVGAVVQQGAVDEDPFGFGVDAERIAGPDDDVGVLARSRASR